MLYRRFKKVVLYQRDSRRECYTEGIYHETTTERLKKGLLYERDSRRKAIPEEPTMMLYHMLYYAIPDAIS